jgi:hypothetical protein
MTRIGLLGFAWKNSKRYIPAALAVATLYVGTVRMLSAVLYPLTEWTLKGINFVILRDFPTFYAVNDAVDGAPWQFHVKVAAQGLIVLVLGMFVGLWANVRAQRHRSQ